MERHYVYAHVLTTITRTHLSRTNNERGAENAQTLQLFPRAKTVHTHSSMMVCKYFCPSPPQTWLKLVRRISRTQLLVSSAYSCAERLLSERNLRDSEARIILFSNSRIYNRVSLDYGTILLSVGYLDLFTDGTDRRGLYLRICAVPIAHLS